MNRTDWIESLRRDGLAADGLSFGKRAAELAAPTIVAPLGDVGVIRANGEDTADFLHNLLTNDVKNLAADGLRRAGFCTPKGRLLADFLIWREGDDHLLLLPADILPAMLKKLSMYVLRAKVKLSDVSDERAVLGIAGSDAATLAATLAGTTPEVGRSVAVDGGALLALAAGRFLLVADAATASAAWGQATASATPAGLDAWRLREIAAGDPRVITATQDQFIPQMINYEQIGGLNFKKGCYPGQEIVARTQYLGKIKRHMYRLAIAQGGAELQPGSAVYAPETGEQACGNLVSVAPAADGGHEALAVIQTSCAEAGDLRLGNPSGAAATVLALPYAIAAAA